MTQKYKNVEKQKVQKCQGRVKRIGRRAVGILDVSFVVVQPTSRSCQARSKMQGLM